MELKYVLIRVVVMEHLILENNVMITIRFQMMGVLLTVKKKTVRTQMKKEEDS